MDLFECRYLQAIKGHQGEIIYYRQKTKTFYKYSGDLQKGNYGYLINLIGIPIALALGNLIQPYWQAQVLYWPALLFLPIVAGMVLLVAGLIIARHYIQKKIEIVSTPVYLAPTNEELVDKGISWLKIQQKIMIVFIVFTAVLGLVAYFSHNILLSIVFMLACICVGLMAASIQPLERQRMYKKFAEELKMKGTDIG